MSRSQPEPDEPVGCPDEGALRGVLDSQVVGDAGGALARHLEACAACQARIERLLAIDPELTELLVRQRTPPPAAPALRAFVQGILNRLEGRRLQAGAAGAGPAGELVATAPRRPSHGPDRIGGYEVLGCAGNGGMGTVYQAVDPRLGRLVALKVLRQDGFRDSSFAERFRREAAVLARLNHPNIVSVYEIAEWQGQPYLALEFVAGGSLARWAYGRALPADVAARAVATLASAVQYAHEQGVIHRDLKPGNILLQPLQPSADPGPAPEAASADPPSLDGFRLMIADFGVARWRGDLSELTRTGEPVGTPAYMAPEQASGQGESVGPAVDLYALGVILYELLTGHPPFRSSDLTETLRRIRQDQAPALRRLRPGLPRDLETITLKCLEKEPGRRYPSAAALADDLTRFLEHRTIVARPVRLPGRAFRWIQRNPQQAALLLALTLSLAIGGLALSLIQTRLRSQAEASAQQADASLRDAVLALDRMCSGLNALGDQVDPRIAVIRDQSRHQIVSWCEQYLQRAPAPERWSVPDLQVANQLIRFQTELGHAAAIEPLARQACQVAERLEAAGADERSGVSLRLTTWLNLGIVLRRSGQLDRARAALAQADAIVGTQLSRQPNDVQILGNRYSIQLDLTESLEALDRPAEALAAALAARATLQAIDAAQPQMAVYRVRAAQLDQRLGRLLGRLGRWPEALATLEAGLRELEPAASDPRLQATVDATRAGLLQVWADAMRHVGAERPWPEGVTALLSRLPDPRPPLAVQVELAARLAAAGAPERARALARSAATEPLTVSQAPVDLAAVLARLVGDTSADVTEREQLATLALAALRQARDRLGLAGARPADCARLRGPEFDPLRDRSEFQPLAAELAPPPGS